MKKGVRRIIFVVVCSIILASIAFAAGSSYTKIITANYVGVQLVVEGTTHVPRDANGDIVEPFIVDGTTYLPVRAVAEALDKEVSWDGDTKTIFIGTDSQNEDAQPSKTLEGTKVDRPQRVSTSWYSVSVGLYQLQIPDYWVQEAEKDHFSACAESGEQVAILSAYSRYSDDVGFEQLDTEEERNATSQVFLSTLGGDDSNNTILSTEIIEIDSTHGVLWSFQVTSSSLPSETGYLFIFPSMENHHWVVLLCLFSDNTEYRYDDSIREIISSIKKTRSTGRTLTGIRSEIKELLDSYEAFMDEYIAFMQRYTSEDTENAASMLSDYYKLLNRYDEFVEKLGALEEDDLTTEEWSYYFEVVNRVNQKLLALMD